MTTTIARQQPADVLDCDWQSVVRRRMDEVLTELAGPLLGPASRVVHARGKLLRPALALTTAALSGRRPDRAVSAAAAAELLHCATLVHDDLIDGAVVRRNVATVNAREGSATAVVTGDLLIAAAYSAAASLGSAAGPLVMRTLAELCVGQALEHRHRFDATTSLDDALAVVRGKTASLLRMACLLGAGAGELPASAYQAISDYATAFGVALQIVDDVLDLVSSADLLGKPVGGDLIAGIATVPVSIALADNAELRALFATGVRADRAMELVRTGDAVTGALAVALEHGQRARAALEPLTGWVDPRALSALAGWPARYLQSLLPSRIAPQHRADVVLPTGWSELG